MSGTFTLKGTAKVTTPGGAHEAVLVEGDCTIEGTEVTTKWWLAEGLGIVRLQYAIAGSDSAPLELKKYSPGQADKSK